MKKKISRGCAVLLACAMLAGLLMTTAFARASDYLAIYSVWATAKSDGVVRIHADVEAVRTSDEVGVSYITVQESDDGGKTWTTLKKYTKEELDRISVEKENGQQDVKYIRGGVEHSLAQNRAIYTASWTNGLNIVSIIGDVTEEELEQMIDSIYT